MRAAEGGRALQLGHPQGWTSAIHTDDVGPAVVAALSAPAGVYNVVDDEPLRRAQVASLLAAAAGRPRLRSYPTWMTRVVSAPVAASARSHRVSNARFKELGWSPSRPSRRDGWPQAFEEWRSSRPIPLPRRPADG
jgi:nucleoside-diphosphate-sugar epimerase